MFTGFSKLTYQERLAHLQKLGYLSQEDVALLTQNQQPAVSLAEHFVENVIGYFPMPLGVAVNFCIDGWDYVIPMAVEETSIIAAASKTARWIKENGEITTEQLGSYAIGQVQFPIVQRPENFSDEIVANQERLVNELNTDIAAGLVKRGGGVQKLQCRFLARPDKKQMAVVHVFVNTCDAMGANIITQICEFLKVRIECLTGEKAGMAILSNLNDEQLIKVQVIIRDINRELGQAISEASLFAKLDPYRAATHNKGIFNAIDSLLVATGNDWRAVEAGAHAYAAQSGQYLPLSEWSMQGKDLIGTLVAPISVGIVGGMTRLHPAAQLALKILKVKSASELARVAAAVGLVQNLGALRALVTQGITQGHMKLHIDNLLLAAGATPEEQKKLKPRLEKMLESSGRITLQDVKTCLETLPRVDINR